MKKLSGIITFFVFAFLYAPILVMIIFSFNSTKSTSVFTGFSLHYYAELFKDEAIFSALKNSVFVATVSALLSTVLGTLAAVGIHKLKRKWMQSAVMTVTNIPMMNPDIVTGVSMMLLFYGAINLMKIDGGLNIVTLIIAHTTFCLPYVILSVLPRVQQHDQSLTEAALDLGCTPIQSFFKIELPGMIPGIFSGLIMAFTLSLDDFVISNFTVMGVETLPLHIFSMVKKDVSPKIYSLSTLMFLAILILLLISNFVGNSDKSPKNRKARKGGKV